MAARGSKPIDGLAMQTSDAREVDAALAKLEPVARTPALRNLLARLLGDIDRLRRELEQAHARIAELERLADEDALMPIANRRAFVRELTRMIAFTQRYGLPSSIVYFDVNNMKYINDTHGHPAGDAALRHVASLLCDNIRATDVVGRLGGDEFGLILARTDQQQANHKAAALAETIAATPLVCGDAQIAISASFGVYSFAGTDDPLVALEAADRAMYRDKRRPARRAAAAPS